MKFSIYIELIEKSLIHVVNLVDFGSNKHQNEIFKASTKWESIPKGQLQAKEKISYITKCISQSIQVIF